MARLWDRLRRRFGGRDEQEHEAASTPSTPSIRGEVHLHPTQPPVFVWNEPTPTLEAAPEVVLPPQRTAQDEPRQPLPPTAWEAPQPAPSAPQPVATDGAALDTTAPDAQPFSFESLPFAPATAVDVAVQELEADHLQAVVEHSAPFDAPPTDPRPLAPFAPDGEPVWDEPFSVPEAEDAEAVSAEHLPVHEDDEDNEDDEGAELDMLDEEAAEPESGAQVEHAPARRGRRREPSELDGQPARLVLPGRPLKRNEVPTLDTPLLLWSHDADGTVVVQPTLYACVQTQWYGPSLYFLVIPWAERDAPERSARLVVDATQLRVAPAEKANP